MIGGGGGVVEEELFFSALPSSKLAWGEAGYFPARFLMAVASQSRPS
jgi:hypothetical protein